MGDARRDMDRAARALEKALDALNGHVKDFSQGSVEQLRVVNSQADIIEDVLNGYLAPWATRDRSAWTSWTGTWMTSANGWIR